MTRVCGCLAVGAVTGVALFGAAAYLLLVYGPDNLISF